MRLLEKCMHAWPMPDMQRQIDSIREAFSADTRKPFILKPSFPYGSPISANNSSPPRSIPSYRPSLPRNASMDQQTIDTQGAVQHTQVSYSGHPISPISVGPLDTKSDSPPTVQSLVLMASGQTSQAPSMQQSMPMTDGAPGWNPSRIFK